ncbi:MAG: Dyp-type peroxidase [Actinomycetota bacterium]|nr:Dyp-type peroxidase [Actinomycetota bacterium]
MSGLTRRGMLQTTLAVAAAGAAGGCAVGAGDGGAASVASAGSATARQFHGAHQVGVVEHPAAFGLLAAFRVVAPDRGALAQTLRAVSAEARNLVDGRTPEPVDPWEPPSDTGVLGVGQRTGVSVTVAVGASLFDDRFGLRRARTRELTVMPYLANDRLDPDRTHGDVLVTLQADRPDALQHALRQLMRRTRSGLVLHWVLDGYNRPDERPTPGRTDNRNLMGFKDGTANPDGTDPALMSQLVWVGPRDGEPAWAVGGSYQAVRTIRMFVEQWDRAPLREQEQILGRHKVSGAPLGSSREEDEPDYAADPHGRQIPLDAHIHLANPRTPHATATRMLRRGFSYSRGFDRAGQLDQGLAFVSYQRRLEHFLEVARRLKGEPLEEYTVTEGGGFFYVLPGARSERDWLGRSLLEA